MWDRLGDAAVLVNMQLLTGVKLVPERVAVYAGFHSNQAGAR